MSFGRLATKFRVLKRKIDGKLSKISSIVMCCAKLHNYIIDYDQHMVEDVLENEELIVPDENAPSGMAYLPIILEEEDVPDIVVGFSNIREQIVNVIAEHEIRRPTYNILRNETTNNINVEEEYFHPS